MAADFADEEFVREDTNDIDIIIIGAGLAGLTCAYNILKKKTGLDVLIIEEADEVGGRILSNVLNEIYHANFLQEHVTELIQVLHIDTDQKEIINMRKQILYTKYGPLQNLPKFYGAEVHSFLQMIEKRSSTLRLNTDSEHNEMKDLAETSVEGLLRKFVYLPFARSLCRAYICSAFAMRNLDDISAFWLFIVLNGALGLSNRLKITVGDNNQYFIQGGAVEIAHKLLKTIESLDGNIKYSESVIEIQFNEDHVYVLTDKNNFRCELVVIAVPPPMHNRIIIEPSSECLLNAQVLYTPSRNVFFKVVYKNPNWYRNSVNNILTTWDTNTNLNLACDASHNNSKGLTFSGILEESDSVHTNEKGLFDTLNECFETTEASKYSFYKEYNHFLDDQMKGGSPMSVMRPTSINNYVNYTGTEFGRVYFASSEYATNWPGTIDGAIESGKDTAYSILYRIRPQALSFHEITTFKLPTEKMQEPVPFRIYAMQNLGLLLNVTIFLSYLKAAYTNT